MTCSISSSLNQVFLKHHHLSYFFFLLCFQDKGALLNVDSAVWQKPAADGHMLFLVFFLLAINQH